MSELKEVFPYFNGIGLEEISESMGPESMDNFYQIKQRIKDQIKNQQNTQNQEHPYYNRSSDSSYFDKLYYSKKESFVPEGDYCKNTEEHIRNCLFCYRKFYQINPVERTNYFLSFVILVLIAILIFKK